MEKIKVVIFGEKDESFDANSDACSDGSCSGSCDSCLGSDLPTMGDLFDLLNNYLSEQKACEKIETQFIDIKQDDMTDHSDVVSAILNGYALPLTKIDGKLRMYGGIDPDRIIEICSKIGD